MADVVARPIRDRGGASETMHVALLTHHYMPEVGAPQRRWRAFVRRFRAAGHRVTVLTPPPHYPLGRFIDRDNAALLPGAVSTGEFGETILRVRFRSHGPGLVSRSLDQAVAATDSLAVGLRFFRSGSNRPDVIIATAPGLPTIPAGMALGAALRRPVTVEMRDAWPDLIEPSGMLTSGRRRSPLRQSAARSAHRFITYLQTDADAVVTTTSAFADVLRERGVRRVHVIRNGSTPELVPALPPPTIHDDLRVLYLGTVGRSQGLDVAVDAAAIARDRGAPVRLRVVGSGAEEALVRQHAEERRAPVDFRGRIPRDQLWEHYGWSDTVVVALRNWPPFAWTVPSKLYEALSTQRHISGSVRGEAAGIIREAQAGFATPPGDAASLADQWTALTRGRSALAVGDRGRQWVNEHANHDLLAERYLHILDEVAARGRRRMLH